MSKPIRPIRVASICHNGDDYRDPLHRRVRLELQKDTDGYVWRTDDGMDCCIGACRTVREAEEAAAHAWGAAEWALRATWWH